jgi:hypothetical protein
MAKSGSEIAPNFVRILLISKLYPNRCYSQYSAPPDFTIDNKGLFQILIVSSARLEARFYAKTKN